MEWIILVVVVLVGFALTVGRPFIVRWFKRTETEQSQDPIVEGSDDPCWDELEEKIRGYGAQDASLPFPLPLSCDELARHLEKVRSESDEIAKGLRRATIARDAVREVIRVDQQNMSRTQEARMMAEEAAREYQQHFNNDGAEQQPTEAPEPAQESTET